MVNQKRFIEATKGKIIVGFLLACFALLLAWGISKFVFGEMLNTVAQLSAPNDRLRIVNELSHQTARLDQLQKDQAFNNDANRNNFILKTRRLRNSLDTLSQLYQGDTAQLQRIKSIKKLLSDRDKQFLAYLKVRETLVNTKSFSDEVKKLNELVSQRSREADSTILTTRTSTSTTTIAPEDGKSKGFLNRLFGKKKAEVYKIIDEEFQVKRDTLNAAVEDSVMRGIESSLLTIEKEQQYKSNRFIRKEADLANASNLITQQMLTLLREVEAETVAQIDVRNADAKVVVGDGIIQITVIILAFFLITLILGYWILRDIGKSNQYRIALEEAKEEAEYHGSAKQRFLSNMSHEIRTPLQSILGYSELIMRQANPNKKHIKAIHSSSTHLLQIVNEVLDYNRIISGKFSLNPQDFNIANVLDEVIAGIIPLADKKQIAFRSSINIGETNFVNGDPFRLKQILFNVLGNAVKFTVKGGVTFKVSAKRTGDDTYFNFIVEDTGIGFDDTNINVIFKEFEQIEKPTHQIINKEGTGLGLAIVKELVDNQGGRIEVKSKVNVGTTFSINLKYPIAKEHTIEANFSEPISKLNKPKVWVIDDDLLILELCGLIFSQQNIPFAKFSSAKQCLNHPIDHDVKFVLVDMRLPDMYGLDLFALLKEKMPNDVKFYAITAQVLPNERDHIIAAGLEGLITKPFKANDLLSIIDQNFTTDQITYDLASLERMTMGDKEMLSKILIQFKKDCLSDIAELKSDVDQQNTDKARLIIHRLAGRISQIGATDLGSEFRILEQKIANTKEINEDEKKKVEVLSSQLYTLIEQLVKTD